jgi:hypothetical protein
MREAIAERERFFIEAYNENPQTLRVWTKTEVHQVPRTSLEQLAVKNYCPRVTAALILINAARNWTAPHR